MPVMKAKDFARAQQSAIVLDMADIEKQAANLLAQASARADQILREARTKANQEGEAIKQTAMEQGRQDGYQAGLAEGMKAGHDEAVTQNAAALQELTKRWNEYLDLLQANIPTHLADMKQDLIRLSITIATRVIKQEGRLNPKVTEANVGEALSLVAAGRKVTLQVHPEQLDQLENYLPDMLAKLRSIPEIELVGDETVEPGGCTLQFGAGAIDATLETQIARISEELLTQENEAQ